MPTSKSHWARSSVWWRGFCSTRAELSSGGAIAALVGRTTARLVGLERPPPAKAVTASLVAALAWINVRGVRIGARVVEVSTVAKLVPLLFFVIAGSGSSRRENFAEAWPTASQVAATTGTLIFAFIGIETALMPTGEVRDPSRTVPRAAMLALGGATLLYLAVQCVAIGLLGPLLGADTVAPLASAASTFAGNTGAGFCSRAPPCRWRAGSPARRSPHRVRCSRLRATVSCRAPRGRARRYRTPHVSIIVYGILIVAMSGRAARSRNSPCSRTCRHSASTCWAVAVLALRHKDVRRDAPAVAHAGRRPWCRS